MADIKVTNKPFPMDQTLCKYCEHRISIVLNPLEPEDFGVDDNTLDSLDMSDDELLLMEQHTCLILNQDMDFIVIDCNYFKEINKTDLLRSEPY